MKISTWWKDELMRWETQIVPLMDGIAQQIPTLCEWLIPWVLFTVHVLYLRVECGGRRRGTAIEGGSCQSRYYFGHGLCLLIPLHNMHSGGTTQASEGASYRLVDLVYPVVLECLAPKV